MTTGGRRGAVRTAGVLVLMALATVTGCSADQDAGVGASSPSSTAAGPAADEVAEDCPTGPPERLVPEVERRFDHDAGAFTQGLVVLDGTLYESTGLEGRSSVRATDPATGDVLEVAPTPDGMFGEGLAVRGDGSLVQLTWKDGRALVWDPDTLSVTDEFAYDGEGWGLTTTDRGTLLMSDGSDRITERDAQDFRALRTWTVARSDGSADDLNELEWDGTRLWANRWQTDEIVRIDVACRRVDAVVDASSLTAETADRAGDDGSSIDVLNGIAHVPGTDRFLVTGKFWPATYEVRFVPAGP
jgi:glutaminyl-peptide cyclotransferase